MSVMGSVLASPRRRRRLAWLGVLLVLVAVVFVATEALPSKNKRPPETFSNQKALDVTAADKPAKVTPRDRVEVSRTLDRFVPAAVARQHPERAIPVSTPNLRKQATLRQWRQGDIPVHPF